jgi:hypothetical protein
MFFCPVDYLQYYHQIHSGTRPGFRRLNDFIAHIRVYKPRLPFQFQRYDYLENRYNLFEDKPMHVATTGASGISRVRCDEAQNRILVGQNNQQLLVNAKCLLPPMKAHDLAENVFQWFHNILTKQNKTWNYEKKFLRFASLFPPNYPKSFQYYLAPTMWLFIEILFIFSFYGFSTLQKNMNNHEGMKFENHLSFVCMEVVCITHGILCVLDVCYYFMLSIQDTPPRALFPKLDYLYCLHGNDIGAPMMTCFFVLLVMAHVILSNPTGSLAQFGWISLLIPYWLTFVLVLALFYYRWKQTTNPLDDDECVGSLIVTIFYLLGGTSMTMVTAFADGIWAVTYPVGYALIPIFPMMALFCLYLSCFIIVWAYQFRTKTKKMIFEIEMNNSTCFRRFLNTLSAVFAFTMLFLFALLLSWSFGVCLGGICHEKPFPSAFIFFVWMFCFNSWLFLETTMTFVLDPVGPTRPNAQHFPNGGNPNIFHNNHPNHLNINAFVNNLQQNNHNNPINYNNNHHHILPLHNNVNNNNQLLPPHPVIGAAAGGNHLHVDDDSDGSSDDDLL